MPLDQPFQSFDDIVAGLTAQIAEFRVSDDERGIFCTAYLAMTQTLQQAVANNAQTNLFQDAQWVTQYAVTFANLYRSALLTSPNCPPAWQVSFDAASNRSALVFQDLLLGINAHINRDLPFAMQTVGIEPRAVRHADHTSVNVVLKQAFVPVESSVADAYAKGLGILANLFNPFDQDLTNFSFEKAREAAWANAVSLVSAPEGEGDAVAQNIETHAGLLAKLILLPTTEMPWLLPILRHIEQAKHWWEFLEG